MLLFSIEMMKLTLCVPLLYNKKNISNIFPVIQSIFSLYVEVING